VSSTQTSTAVPTSALARIVIIGNSSAGKSTLARALAGRLACPHIELDALHWQKNWVARELPDFRARVGEAIAAPSWVVDGNYSQVRDLVWARATAIIWLNYRFRIIFWRAVTRTIRRIARREILFGDNRETIRKSFFSRDSILWWVIRTYRKRRRQFPLLLAEPAYAELRIFIFEHPRDAQRFLDELPASGSPRSRT
jgi:adenylate kinase family enzyme